MQALVYTGTMVKMALEAKKHKQKLGHTSQQGRFSRLCVCEKHSHADFSQQHTVKRLHVEQNFDPHKENSTSLANLAENAVKFKIIS